MKITKFKKQKTKGFTLVEIIIFTAVSGIFIVLVFSVLNSFLRSRTTARRLSALQETTTYVFNDLTQEIHWSDEAEPSTNYLKLIQIESDETELEIIYQVDSQGRLLKNEEPISLPRVVVNNFTITNRAPEDKVPCLEIELSLEYSGSKPKIVAENKTTISLRKTKLQFLEE